MSIDIDINNYNYQELLNIFKIDNNYSEENTSIMQKLCSVVKNKYSHDIYNFYNKAQKIIHCIYSLFKMNIILNFEDLDIINHYVDKIKKIKNFEKYDNDVIFENYLKPLVKESVEININEYFPSLNETNYTLGSKPNPSLNNKNNTNYVVSTFANSIAPGQLNSIKRITFCQNLNLNTCFRNNYYTCSSTDFQYLLPCEIKNVVSLRLASIEIPNAWYLFSHKQKNNVFKIIVDADKKLTSYTIVIPDGNYDNESLQQFLNTTYFYESNLESCLKYIRFSIDSYNFKTRFEIIEDHPCICKFSFSLIFFEDINENLMNTVGWMLGFRLPRYDNICENIQSEGLFDGSGDRYIYLCLNDYQYNTNITNIVGFDKSSMEENILAKIPMINGKLSLIIDDNNNPLTKTRKYNGPVNIRKIHVKVLDKFGNVIDLNNMDFSFTLEVEILYESFNFKDVTA